MNKKTIIGYVIIFASIVVLMLAATVITVNSEEDGGPVKMRVTCYTATGNPTASGCMPYEGIVAGKREWLGYVAILYDLDMNYIGMYEFRDTGGAESLRNGTSIDVYRDTLEGCYDWIEEYGDYLYVEIIPAVG